MDKAIEGRLERWNAITNEWHRTAGQTVTELTAAEIVMQFLSFGTESNRVGYFNE